MVTNSKLYIPDRGDIIYINLDPTRGREQKGRRPAFVISPYSYNKRTSLSILMPITSQKKGYPFEVNLPDGIKTYGVILTDQMKCLDWTVRDTQFIESVPKTLIEEVQAKITPLLL